MYQYNLPFGLSENLFINEETASSTRDKGVTGVYGITGTLTKVAGLETTNGNGTATAGVGV